MPAAPQRRARILQRRELLELARTVMTNGGGDLEAHEVEALALGCVLLDSDVRTGRDELERERGAHWTSRADLEAARTEVVRLLASFDTAIRERDEARALILDRADRSTRVQAPHVATSSVLEELLLADPPPGLPWQGDADETVVVDVGELEVSP